MLPVPHAGVSVARARPSPANVRAIDAPPQRMIECVDRDTRPQQATATARPARRARRGMPPREPPDIIERAVPDCPGGEALDDTGPPIDYEALVRRLTAGERAAAHALYQSFFPSVRLMLYCRTGQPHVADDLAQQTFVIALQKLQRGDPPREPDKLPAYLHGIAKNVYRNHVREDQRHAAVPIPEDTPAREYVPYEQVHRDQIAEAVRRLIGEMGVKRDRDIIRRVYVLDQPKKRVCGDLGLPSTTFDRVIWRARLRFRELLRDLGVNPDDYTRDPDS